MRTVPVDDFLPTLRQMVSTPLPMQMKDAIVKSAIRFCRKTGVVFSERTIYQVYEGQTIKAVSGSRVNRKSGGNLKASDKSEISIDGVELIAGQDFTHIEMDDIYFLRDLRNVSIRCAVEPAPNAKELPAKLLDDWVYGVCAGAASCLYGQPSIMNGDMHAYYEREFIEQSRHASRWRLETQPQTTRPTRKRSFF